MNIQALDNALFRIEREQKKIVDMVSHLHDDVRVLSALARANLRQGVRTMSIGQDILDAVTAEGTAVDSFIAYVKGLVENNTITPDVAAAIIAEANENKAKLEAAMTANVTPPTA